MVRLLFEEFLENDEQYHACERYWEDLLSRSAASVGQPDDWKREVWTYPDGTLWEMDGNPMFVARSDRHNRNIRILQHPATGDALEIVAYLKTYEERHSGLPTFDELVVNLCLSQESARLAEALLRKWMTPETTIEEMELFIDETLPAKND
jgi:hypothetical protein